MARALSSMSSNLLLPAGEREGGDAREEELYGTVHERVVFFVGQRKNSTRWLLLDGASHRRMSQRRRQGVPRVLLFLARSSCQKVWTRHPQWCKGSIDSVQSYRHWPEVLQRLQDTEQETAGGAEPIKVGRASCCVVALQPTCKTRSAWLANGTILTLLTSWGRRCRGMFLLVTTRTRRCLRPHRDCPEVVHESEQALPRAMFVSMNVCSGLIRPDTK